MEVKRYNQFVNEAKKDDAKADLLSMFEKKPTVTMSSEKWPTEKGIYSQSGMINYLKGKFTSGQVLNALHDLKNDKKVALKHISVKNHRYNESYPYYYIGLSEAEAKDLKEKYEDANEASNKGPMAKKKEDNEKVKAAAAKAEESEPKKPAKKVAPKKVAPKKVAPKKAEPAAKAVAKKVAPKKVPAKKVAPKKVTPKKK